MDGFPGFPDGRLALVPVPEAFFSELLPLIDNLSELKVTLHCLWAVTQKRGAVRYITERELAQDDILMRGLVLVRDDESLVETTPLERLRYGLERAVARGTLLQVTVKRKSGREEKLYFVNGERGRAAVKRIERGEWLPPDEEPVQLRVRRPNIFNLYEQNIGLIHSPLLADELRDAERTYPTGWIEEAFRIAVVNNARRWAYVRGILERWAREGRDRPAQRDRRHYADDEYADFVRR